MSVNVNTNMVGLAVNAAAGFSAGFVPASPSGLMDAVAGLLHAAMEQGVPLPLEMEAQLKAWHADSQAQVGKQTEAHVEGHAR